ncbi:TPA: hypothetical protein ACUQTZ_004092 [Escherichia coli]
MYAICEVVQEFDEEFDGDLCRVKKVLQVFPDAMSAYKALDIFEPGRYGDYDTVLRVVHEQKLGTKFR